MAVGAICRHVDTARIRDAAVVSKTSNTSHSTDLAFSRALHVTPVNGHGAGMSLTSPLPQLRWGQESILLIPVHLSGFSSLFWLQVQVFWTKKMSVQGSVIELSSYLSCLFPN